MVRAALHGEPRQRAQGMPREALRAPQPLSGCWRQSPRKIVHVCFQHKAILVERCWHA